MNADASFAPTSSAERILAVDVLRGFALLGILLMNIQGFAMVSGAYLNPTVYGNLDGANRWAWILCHVFVDQKFISIFSLLFGAGILLLAQRVEARGRNSAKVHYRRTGWLLLIGLAHAYLVWYGDILVTYALCALVVYWFRNLRPVWLTTWGLLALAVPSLIFLVSALSFPYWPPDAIAGMRQEWSPSLQQITWEVGVYRGHWWGQMSHRVPVALEFQTFIFAIWMGWRAAGMMLLGMALLKSDILTARRTPRFYATMAIAGCLPGFALVVLGVMRNFAADWSLEYSFFIGPQYNYWGSVFVALGYVGIVMLVVQAGALTWMRRALAAVGRTALTNYLGQSFICTLIFYGEGLALFGRVERWLQVLIVIGVWAIQIPLSLLWLRHFQFGPMEWLWRSLTYWRLQPIRLSTASPAEVKLPQSS